VAQAAAASPGTIAPAASSPRRPQAMRAIAPQLPSPPGLHVEPLRPGHNAARTAAQV
jgi:hypothetical protein